jgi:hypothetical protein
MRFRDPAIRPHPAAAPAPIEVPAAEDEAERTWISGSYGCGDFGDNTQAPGSMAWGIIGRSDCHIKITGQAYLCCKGRLLLSRDLHAILALATVHRQGT